MAGPGQFDVSSEMRAISRLMPTLSRDLKRTKPDARERIEAAMYILCNYNVAKHRPPAQYEELAFEHGDFGRYRVRPWSATHMYALRQDHQYALSLTRGANPVFCAKMTKKWGAGFGNIGDYLQLMREIIPKNDADGYLIPDRVRLSKHAISRAEAQNLDPQALLDAVKAYTNRIPIHDELKFTVDGIEEVQQISDAAAVPITLDGVQWIVPIGTQLYQGMGRMWTPKETVIITVYPEGNATRVGMQLGKDVESDRLVDQLSTWMNMVTPDIWYRLENRSGTTTYHDLNDGDCAMRLGGISVERIAALRATSERHDAFVRREIQNMFGLLASLCDVDVTDVEPLLYNSILCEFVSSDWYINKPEFGSAHWTNLLGYYAVAQRFAITPFGVSTPSTWMSASIAMTSLYPPPLHRATLFYPRMWSQFLPFKHMGKALGDLFGRYKTRVSYKTLDRLGHTMVESHPPEVFLEFSSMTDAFRMARAIVTGNSPEFPRRSVVLIRTLSVLIAVTAEKVYVTLFRLSNIIKDRDVTALSAMSSETALASQGYGPMLTDLKSGIYTRHTEDRDISVAERIRAGREASRALRRLTPTTETSSRPVRV